ncbi:hypothetical protein BJ138DRAFT_1116854 [Hygrophoropsis aurantiaca]|uniref:Uncharacterized protein n=1 Tax=Hygrophoropsis aurantiaca TaxID=72124 RepID=A0ACB8A234_9AGAM|nr:hypothetical protein BJ138DRAFT_1116854 [Hygrophoropsis aurantiaca]
MFQPFPCLITTAIFGTDCDASLPVQVPYIQPEVRGTTPGDDLLLQIYLCHSKVPQFATNDNDSDDSLSDNSLSDNSPSDSSAQLVAWKMLAKHKSPHPYLSQFTADYLKDRSGEDMLRLENRFIIYYVKQEHASKIYLRNNLVESIAQIHQPPCNRTLYGNIMLVKTARADKTRLVDFTQSDISMARAVVAK